MLLGNCLHSNEPNFNASCSSRYLVHSPAELFPMCHFIYAFYFSLSIISEYQPSIACLEIDILCLCWQYKTATSDLFLISFVAFIVWTALPDMLALNRSEKLDGILFEVPLLHIHLLSVYKHQKITKKQLREPSGFLRFRPTKPRSAHCMFKGLGAILGLHSTGDFTDLRRCIVTVHKITGASQKMNE